MDLFLTNTLLLSSPDVNWWTGVVWIIVMFLSAVWTHSDGTHSLQSIHWWDTDAMLWWRNKLIYILDDPRMSICSFLGELVHYSGIGLNLCELTFLPLPSIFVNSVSFRFGFHTQTLLLENSSIISGRSDTWLESKLHNFHQKSPAKIKALTDVLGRHSDDSGLDQVVCKDKGSFLQGIE